MQRALLKGLSVLAEGPQRVQNGRSGAPSNRKLGAEVLPPVCFPPAKGQEERPRGSFVGLKRLEEARVQEAVVQERHCHAGDVPWTAAASAEIEQVLQRGV